MSSDIVIDELMESLDADHSGKVSAEELLDAIKGSGIDMDAVKEHIKSIDNDGDGQINRTELQEFFKSLGY
ncbi:unnamed protein product [Dibothriocephalus latus]|uniref:EF-hand domain-containing protein n=1 Tax=Dibothriocephalus latus TaxID=60516 RepID=A0A3P7LAC5_DIBLA|nr:unnamed protein product [Dibothriocephalus latus]